MLGVKSQVLLTTNGVIHIFDWKTKNTAILQLTINTGDNSGKSLGVYLTISDLEDLREMINYYLDSNVHKSEVLHP